MRVCICDSSIVSPSCAVIASNARVRMRSFATLDRNAHARVQASGPPVSVHRWSGGDRRALSPLRSIPWLFVRPLLSRERANFAHQSAVSRRVGTTSFCGSSGSSSEFFLAVEAVSGLVFLARSFVIVPQKNIHIV